MVSNVHIRLCRHSIGGIGTTIPRTQLPSREQRKGHHDAVVERKRLRPVRRRHRENEEDDEDDEDDDDTMPSLVFRL